MAGPRRLTSCGLGTVLVSERAVFCSSTKPNLLDISDLNNYIINLVVCFFLPRLDSFAFPKRRLGLTIYGQLVLKGKLVLPLYPPFLLDLLNKASSGLNSNYIILNRYLERTCTLFLCPRDWLLPIHIE